MLGQLVISRCKKWSSILTSYDTPKMIHLYLVPYITSVSGGLMTGEKEKVKRFLGEYLYELGMGKILWKVVDHNREDWYI